MTKVSPLEWKWRRWRMRVGEYRGYKGPRPKAFPKRIPAAWWVRLTAWQAAQRAKEQQNQRPSCSLLTPTFTTPGALWRQSDSEDIARAAKAGLGWALLQLDADDWSVLTAKLDRAGIPWGWWFHCRTHDQMERLLRRSHGRPIVGLNVEKELETTLTPRVVRSFVDDSGYEGQPAMIVYGWVQNNVRVTDHDMGRVSWLLEMFPSDAPELDPPVEKLAVCLDHARRLGIRYPAQMMQAYDDAKPWWYDRDAVPNSVYTADDIDDRWEMWLP
jgi:hypothetical protein